MKSGLLVGAALLFLCLPVGANSKETKEKFLTTCNFQPFTDSDSNSLALIIWCDTGYYGALEGEKDGDLFYGEMKPIFGLLSSLNKQYPSVVGYYQGRQSKSASRRLNCEMTTYKDASTPLMHCIGQ